jgi:formamidopyrimidine-DNA glycosylase
MPELPEVETTLRGIAPTVIDSTISDIVVRNASLRWPVPTRALSKLVGQSIIKAERRAKYILLHTPKGVILLHLGMSGSLSIVDLDNDKGQPKKHDHIDLQVVDKQGKPKAVRLNDPRRFGCCLLLTEPIFEHKLLANLGPEPFDECFDGEYIFKRSRGRSIALKNFIMDGKIVVGVGNIYASEALFTAGIRPSTAAKRISKKRYQKLVTTIKQVLGDAIKAGGTSLNDFTQADGKPGYFKQELNVYGRVGQPCLICHTTIKSQMIGQRNTFYCPNCQTF